MKDPSRLGGLRASSASTKESADRPDEQVLVFPDPAKPIHGDRGARPSPNQK